MTQPNETSAVFTDPNLNNYQDLVNRVAALEEALLNHTGDTLGSSGAFAPHPIQIIDSAEFGGGTARLDTNGMQMLLNAYGAVIPTLTWNTPLRVNPTGTAPGAITELYGRVDATNTYMFMGAISPNGNGLGYIQAVGSNTQSYVQIGVPLLCWSTTADPASPTDGMSWYRSDLNAFRFRAGGVTSSLTLP